VKYLNGNGFSIKLNITDLPKISRIPKGILTDDKVKEYMAIINYNSSSFGEPYRTALLLLPYTGLRINECISLKLSDVGRNGDVLFLKVLGKGNKYREVPILQDGQVILKKYLAGWRSDYYHKYQKAIYLFPKSFKSHITYSNVYKKIKLIAKSMGELITPHTFRSTYATKLSNSGINTTTIMRILGHASSTTTLLYDRPKVNELYSRIKDIKY